MVSPHRYEDRKTGEWVEAKIWFRAGLFGRMIPMVTITEIWETVKFDSTPPPPGYEKRPPEVLRTWRKSFSKKLTWELYQKVTLAK